MAETTLRRYTELPALLYLLRERQVTLLDPASWDDTNDSYYMTLYKERKGLKTLLAACFAESEETYHHWRVFANGSSGVCIQFDKALLCKTLKRRAGLRMHNVQYLTLDEVRNEQLLVEELPFRKRYAFQHENEYRIIYESKTKTLSSLDVPISLSCISRITLSPWVHDKLADQIRKTLKSITGCEDIKIFRSTLIGNEQWKRLGEAAVVSHE